LKNGRFLKEKSEYLKERFTTKEGIFEFFVSSLIWGFIAVSYTSTIFGKIMEFLSFVPEGLFRTYIGYMVFSIFMTVIGWAISCIIIKIFHFIKRT